MDDSLQKKTIKVTSDYEVYMIDNGFFIDTINPVDIRIISELVKNHPQIKISSFKNLQEACVSPPRKQVQFGVKAEEIELDIAANGMTVHVKLNMETNFWASNRSKTTIQILEMLKAKNVVFGIKYQVIEELKPGEKTLIAEGQKAVDGKDSQIVLPDLQKNLSVEGEEKADFYDLQLIYNVKSGEWTGERIEADKGTPGKNVFGSSLEAKEGKKHNLFYDKTTIEEYFSEAEQRTVLSSKVSGSLEYLKDKKTLSVFNCLEVDNVDFSTGNIDIDGFLIVRNTICDGFVAKAKKGIEVQGNMGIGSCSLYSDGKILIKGGVNGNGNCTIKSGGVLFTKFINKATVEVDGLVSVGFYCFDSIVTAIEIQVGTHKNGKVVGGVLTALSLIQALEVGSLAETPTALKILGFNREELMKKRLDGIEEIEKYKNDIISIAQKLKIIRVSSGDSPGMAEKAASFVKLLNEWTQRIESLEAEQKRVDSLLKCKGEGEVRIAKKLHRNTTIAIKNDKINIFEETMGGKYYYDQEIKIKS